MLRAVRHPLLALVCAGALFLTACGGTASTSPGEEGALGHGIGVKGAWTIDVLDPDGTLVESVDFTNDLQDAGADRLGQLLGRTRVPGEWSVLLFGGACHATEPSNLVPCSISEPTRPAYVDDDSFFNDLTVEPVAAGLTLRGSAVAMLDGAIDAVWTRLTFCEPFDSDGAVVTSSDCLGVGNNDGVAEFTATTVASVAVAEGQIVQVTVELSFGTLPAA